MLEEYKGTQPNQQERLDEANIRSDILVTDRIVTLLGDIKGLRILELGSGNGKVARKLHALGAVVTGVDVVPEQIKIAATRGPAGIRYIEADFTANELTQRLSGESFDIALSVMSLFYSSSTQIQSALKNVHTLLRPGGRFIIGTASPYRGLKREGFDYFKEQESGVTLPSKTSEPFTTRYIHMPLESLVNECLAAGFVLTRLSEPRATQEQLLQYPDILVERDRYAPDYIILEFSK